MTHIYRVNSGKQLHFSDPLHVGRFYPDIERHHYRSMQNRQDLILYLANLHATAMASGKPAGFCEIPIRLTTLREWVHDFRVVLDHFFDVRQLGYNLGGENFEVSTITPKILKNGEIKAASEAAENLVYIPPDKPDGGIISKVYIKQENSDAILEKLIQKSRLDLQAPVKWLLSQPEVNFWFAPAGRLKLRDTSIYPIPAIETWPSWLREDLFGAGLDIDSAYTQFLLENLQVAYANSPALLQTLYPDLIRSLNDKAEWRGEICDLLGLPRNEDSVSVVKNICMALANGSTISPAILNGDSSYSITRDIVISEVQDVSIKNLTQIGERLQSISKQYKNARKAICLHLSKKNPSRLNQKSVFKSYFEWERIARYQIWEAVDRHGIMVHDGIDGIPDQYLQNMQELIRNLNIKLTRS